MPLIIAAATPFHAASDAELTFRHTISLMVTPFHAAFIFATPPLPRLFSLFTPLPFRLSLIFAFASFSFDGLFSLHMIRFRRHTAFFSIAMLPGLFSLAFSFSPAFISPSLFSPFSPMRRAAYAGGSQAHRRKSSADARQRAVSFTISIFISAISFFANVRVVNRRTSGVRAGAPLRAHATRPPAALRRCTARRVAALRATSPPRSPRYASPARTARRSHAMSQMIQRFTRMQTLRGALRDARRKRRRCNQRRTTSLRTKRRSNATRGNRTNVASAQTTYAAVALFFFAAAADISFFILHCYAIYFS
jgi:hypothetical protein